MKLKVLGMYKQDWAILFVRTLIDGSEVGVIKQDNSMKNRKGAIYNESIN